VGRILIVEDDTNIARLLDEQLDFEGHETVRAVTQQEALARVGRGFDLVILDLGLPGGNGFEVCREIRRRGLEVPIIVLTAHRQTVDKVRALDLGADDYLTKPFDLQELLARVRACLRRGSGAAAASATLRSGDLEIDVAGRQASVAGVEIHLTGREMALLELLMNRPGKVVPRDEFLERLWPGIYVTSRTVDVHVGALRRKLERQPGATPRIVTVRGTGYKLVGPLG
jgi:DNA-binding response OmpR family regulator